MLDKEKLCIIYQVYKLIYEQMIKFTIKQLDVMRENIMRDSKKEFE